MSIYETLVEIIDLRSFSNLWYWIGLAVIWSSASHWVLGIPYDLVLRARRRGGQPYEDLVDLVRINVNRILGIVEISGMWLVGFVSFMLTGLALLSFWYDVEFAQAVFFIAFPMTFVGLMSYATARRIRKEAPEGEALFAILSRHRFFVQLIGMLALLLTAMFGMYQNLTLGPFQDL